MHYPIKPDEHKLHIFHESKKRRTFVGELHYNTQTDTYELNYNKNYTLSKNAIPLSPELNLFKLQHQSEKGKLFPAFIDRIPDKSNPAYNDYCRAEGVSPEEVNPIILLGTIGKRGPSSFVFEPVYHTDFDPSAIKAIRSQLNITQHDFALALDINIRTLQRIESGISQDISTLKHIQILLSFPDVARWQLKKTGGKVHKDILNKLMSYFRDK